MTARDLPETIEVVDSHTEGEPTRVVIGGWPELAAATMEARREELDRRFGPLWRGAILEPRGHDALVGALLTPPVSHGAVAGVVFFDNVGPLWMCGHGTIGVVRTLEHLGRITPGSVRLDTPVGPVGAELSVDGLVTIENVPAQCRARDVAVEVPGIGRVVGDVAYGGNWFFLVEQNERELTVANTAELTDVCRRIRGALNAKGFADVDHVELFARPMSAQAQSRSFVLCPGDAYDRSPCGTGTSAKLACLAADGKLAEGAPWVQESVVGTTFKASYRWLDRDAGRIEPTITGTAFVNAESTHIIDERDPFSWGMR